MQELEKSQTKKNLLLLNKNILILTFNIYICIFFNNLLIPIQQL